jgi:hypothetical protein
LVAGLAFLRLPLKRGIQARAMRVADYAFWGHWDTQRQGHKGDFNTLAKERAQQSAYSQAYERRGRVTNSLNSLSNQDAASSSLDESDESLEPVLKSVDLNRVLSYNEKDKVVAK